LNDGTVKSNYFKDTLGVAFYRPLDKSHFPLPPSGWCTWYYYYNRINADEVHRTQIGSPNLKDFGAKYVQIDDGWQGLGGRDWTHVNPAHFPDGMAALASYIKAAGLTPGIWLAPHGQSNPDVVTNNPDTFLLQTNGEPPSGTWEGRYLLDPTTPQSHAYFRDLFQHLKDWGYDYFKIDGQPIVVDEYRQKKKYMKNPSDDAPALYRTTLEDIRAVIGPDRYLLGRWGMPIEGAGIMNGSRTGGDIDWDGAVSMSLCKLPSVIITSTTSFDIAIPMSSPSARRSRSIKPAPGPRCKN
jgi:alpha-galactosidase